MVFGDDKRELRKKHLHFSHGLRAFFHCKFPESKSQSICGSSVSVQVSSKGNFKLTRDKLIGIRLWVRPVLNRNQCHGSARSSNLSDKNDTQSVGRNQLWHSQIYWKFVWDNLQYPLLCPSSEVLLSKHVASQNKLCQTTGSCLWRKLPLALKIIFVGIPLVLCWEEIKPPQLYKKIVKRHSQHAKKRQSSTKLLSVHILLKVMLVYASSILATT